MSKIPAEIVQQSIHCAHYKCTPNYRAPHLIQVYLYKTRCTLQYINLLVILVNFRLSKSTTLNSVNTSTFSKNMEFTDNQLPVNRCKLIQNSGTCNLGCPQATFAFAVFLLYIFRTVLANYFPKVFHLRYLSRKDQFSSDIRCLVRM